MKPSRILLLTVFLVHFVSLLEIKAQQSSIAGCVYENGNIPLSFASIIVKGQPIGAQTDEQGNYVHIHLYESMMWDDNNKCWKYVLRENEYNLKFNVEFEKTEQHKIERLMRI